MSHPTVIKSALFFAVLALIPKTKRIPKVIVGSENLTHRHRKKGFIDPNSVKIVHAKRFGIL